MFLGRGAEMERVDRLTEAAVAGHGECLLVVGVPGIGKTALLDVAARRAARRGVTVLRARAPEGCADIPFALVDDVMVAAGGTPVGGGGPRRSARLHDLLGSTCATGPVLLLIDDVHNADDGSLEALATAIGRDVDRRISTVVAARPEPAALARFAAWDRLDLPPLSGDAAAAVLRTVLGPDVDGTVLGSLGRTLQGLPLALREAGRLLTAEQIAGSAPLPEPLPVAPALMAAWTAVLDRQPDRTRWGLLDLAVAGARPDLLAALQGEGLWTVDDLDPAVAAGLLVTAAGRPPDFTHPLLRDVVLRGAPAALLRARHGAAAASADQLSLAPAIVVHHLVRSVVMGDADAADAVAAQADRAVRLGHLDAAVRAWAVSARLSLDPGLRVERAINGVRLVARFDLGVSGVEPLLELLSGVELDPQDSGWVSWLQAVSRANVDPHAALVGQWTAIEARREDSPGLLPVLLWEAAMSAWTLGLPDLGLDAAREIAELEPLVPDTGRAWPTWTGTAMLAAGLIQAGDVEAGVELRERALAEADRVDPSTLDLGMLLDAVFLDDLLLDDGIGGARRLSVAADRLRNAPESLACLWGIEAWRARASGDWSAARSLLARARPLADEAGANGAARGMAALATELASACDDLPDALAEADRLRALTDRWGDRRRRATHDRSLGLRALLDGRLEDSIALLTAAADVPFLGRGLRDGVVPARVDLVEAASRRGDRELAEVWQGRVHGVLIALDSPTGEALASRVDALVAETQAEADAGYRAAIAAHVRSAERFEHARTLLLYGEHLRRTARRREARLALADAVTMFERLGATPWRERAVDELRACGAAPSSAAVPAASWGSLTPQERAVAEAVSAGRSNQEAADFLSLSPRTVEHHLGSCYRKLGVRGRVALARAVQLRAAGAGASADGR